MNFTKYSYKPSYFLYNYDNINKLDLNKIDDDIVVFPNNLYKGECIMEPHFKKDPVDTNTVYWVKQGVHHKHPPFLSKFGRMAEGCPFGYCYGAQSGRNYNLPPMCHHY